MPTGVTSSGNAHQAVVKYFMHHQHAIQQHRSVDGGSTEYGMGMQSKHGSNKTALAKEQVRAYEAK